MKATKKTAGETATGSGARVRLDDIKAEQIAFLPDTAMIRGALYCRVCWVYKGEGDNLSRIGFGWANYYAAVPNWATPAMGSARRGDFVLGNVSRRGKSTSKNGWDLVIDSITEGRAE